MYCWFHVKLQISKIIEELIMLKIEDTNQSQVQSWMLVEI